MLDIDWHTWFSTVDFYNPLLLDTSYYKENKVGYRKTYAFSLLYNRNYAQKRESVFQCVSSSFSMRFLAIILHNIQPQLTIFLSAAWHALIELCDWNWNKLSATTTTVSVIPGRTAGRRRKVAAFIAVAGRRQREPGGWVVTGFKGRHQQQIII